MATPSVATEESPVKPLTPEEGLRFRTSQVRTQSAYIQLMESPQYKNYEKVNNEHNAIVQELGAKYGCLDCFDVEALVFDSAIGQAKVKAMADQAAATLERLKPALEKKE